MLVRLDFVGNPYIGVYCASSDDLLVVAPTVPRRAVDRMRDALETTVIQTTIGGSTVIGSLITLNGHGVVMSGFATEEEIKTFKGLNVLAPPHKLNAMGNNILCNDKGALVHASYDNEFVKAVRDTLDVEIVKGTIAGIRTVGSWGVATNKGVLCHPHTKDEEKKILEDVLKIPASITTANYGTAQVGACMIANDKGAVVGSRTTPIEIGRIEDGLKLY